MNGPKKYRFDAYCSSDSCWVEHFKKPLKKRNDFMVPKKFTDMTKPVSCPDCSHALFWERTEIKEDV
jgi:hypothetical protein